MTHVCVCCFLGGGIELWLHFHLPISFRCRHAKIKVWFLLVPRRNLRSKINGHRTSHQKNLQGLKHILMAMLTGTCTRRTEKEENVSLRLWTIFHHGLLKKNASPLCQGQETLGNRLSGQAS